MGFRPATDGEWEAAGRELAELDRLRAELARVRSERDRLFASGFFDHFNECDPFGDRRDPAIAESIRAVLEWMTKFELLGSEHARHRAACAAALAEHDRRAGGSAE